MADTAKPASKRLNRAVYGVFLTIAAVFIVSSTMQVARAVFATPAVTPKVGEACSATLAAAVAGIDAAVEAASSAPDAEEAKKRYQERLKSASAVDERICRGDPNGLDAMAALGRYERAAETYAAAAATRRKSELSPVRLRAQSFIRQDAR